ncbi:hypothetical protein G6O69_15850 [Pseudenhygromyxa sp. WMMC2535]|uniref:hypothetical protein n=1 Tax=Pseudenhygromyxa sp. WMMC2535 TaxID=2712867 RepID=UPI001553E241|nr:hypothetical protein [Pseudenhygromyxa sp. WMMC2535]NVB39317.1 hypothetical protein [Pseudenhygromyxa sp. WMMC2535]
MRQPDTDDATPEPEPEPVGVLTTLSGGPPAGCPAPSVPTCAGEHTPLDIASLLEQRPSGVVEVAGTAEETDTACTNSAPPSCASSLALRDTGRGPKLTLVAAPGGPNLRCHNGCCGLVTGGSERYLATGELAPDPDHPAVLRATSVCRLP